MATWNITAPASGGSQGDGASGNSAITPPEGFDGSTIISVTVSGSPTVSTDGATNDTIGVRFRVQSDAPAATYGDHTSDAASICYVSFGNGVSADQTWTDGTTRSPAPTTAVAADWDQIAWAVNYANNAMPDGETVQWSSFTIVVDYTPSAVVVDDFPTPDQAQLDGKIPDIVEGYIRSPDAASLTLSAGTPLRARKLSLTGSAPTVNIAVLKAVDQETLQLTGQAPSVSYDWVIPVAQDDLQLTGQTPTISVGISINVPTGTLEITGLAPVVAFDWVIPVAQETLTITEQTPVRVVNHIRGPPQETLAITGEIPTLDEVAGSIVEEPGKGSLQLTGAVPTTLINHIQAPAQESLLLTGAIPTLAFDWVITPDAGSLALTGQIPDAGGSVTRTPDAESLALTGSVPTVVFDWVITPDQDTLQITGSIPTVKVSILRIPDQGTAALTGLVPTLGFDWVVAPDQKALTLTGQTPLAQSDADKTARPATGSLSITGQQPRRPWEVRLTGYAPSLGIQIPVGKGSLSTTGLQPTNGESDNIIVIAAQTYLVNDYVFQDYVEDPSPTALALSGSAPSVTNVGTSPTVNVDTGSLTATGIRPVIAEDLTVQPGTGSLSITGYLPRRPWEVRLTGYAPDAFTGGNPVPATVNISLTGYVPGIAEEPPGTKRVGKGSVALEGYSPATTIFIDGADASLQITGYIPTFTFRPVISEAPGTGSAALTGQTPTVKTSNLALPDTKNLSLTGLQPVVGEVAKSPDTGSLSLTGQAPIVEPYPTPNPGSLNLTGTVPTFRFGFFWLVPVAQKALSLTGQAPTVTVATPVPNGSLALTGQAPTLGQTAAVSTGSLTLSGNAPPIDIGENRTIQVPIKTRDPYVDPDYVIPDYILDNIHSVNLTTYSPSTSLFSPDREAAPDTGSLGLSSYIVTIDNGGRGRACIVRPESRTRTVRPRKHITVVKPDYRGGVSLGTPAPETPPLVSQGDFGLLYSRNFDRIQLDPVNPVTKETVDSWVWQDGIVGGTVIFNGVFTTDLPAAFTVQAPIQVGTTTSNSYSFYSGWNSGIDYQCFFRVYYLESLSYTGRIEIFANTNAVGYETFFSDLGFINGDTVDWSNEAL